MSAKRGPGRASTPRPDPEPQRFRCGVCSRAVALSRGRVLLPHKPQRADQAYDDGNCLGTRSAPGVEVLPVPAKGEG